MLVKDKGSDLVKEGMGAQCDPVCLVLEAEGTAPAVWYVVLTVQ